MNAERKQQIEAAFDDFRAKREFRESQLWQHQLSTYAKDADGMPSQEWAAQCRAEDLALRDQLDSERAALLASLGIS
jgi:hypothetical protein